MGKRKMPGRKAIAAHWSARLVEMGRFDSDSEVMESVTCSWCWKCGQRTPFGATERCHIEPEVDGGGCDVSNLHLLCPACHRYSEMLTGVEYWEWFNGDGLPTSEWLSYMGHAAPLLVGKIMSEHLEDLRRQSVNFCQPTNDGK